MGCANRRSEHRVQHFVRDDGHLVLACVNSHDITLPLSKNTQPLFVRRYCIGVLRGTMSDLDFTVDGPACKAICKSSQIENSKIDGNSKTSPGSVSDLQQHSCDPDVVSRPRQPNFAPASRLLLRSTQ
jgi:hypothetical protein